MKIVVIVVAVIIVSAGVLFATQYLPSKAEWDKCQEQMAQAIEQDNTELQKNNSDLKVQCETHKKTYDTSKACFAKVSDYNFLTKMLLKSYRIKSMEKLKEAQAQYCSQYPETLVN